MKQVFRFVGTEVEIGAIKLNRFGERIMLDESIACDVRKAAPLITEDEFNSIGFTDEDLKVWADPMVARCHQPAADSEQAHNLEMFEMRKDMAQQVWRETRAKLKEHNNGN